MTALTADRNAPSRAGDIFSYPVAAGEVIYKGALVVLDTSGNLEAATTATGKVAVGRAVEYVDNSAGGAAAVNCEVEAGVFRWENSDSITKTSIGDTAYAVDDQTVSKANSSQSACGTIVDVDDDGVWVLTSVPWITATGLTAANNLSDVNTPATARTNLGLTDASINDISLLNAIITGLKRVNDAQAMVRKSVVIDVSATELRTLAASPKTLIAGQAGIAYVFERAIISYRGGSNVFDSVGAGEDLAIRQTDGSGTIVSETLDTTTDINFGATTDAEAVLNPVASVTNPLANTALVLDNIGGGELATTDDDSDGDGTVQVVLEYLEYTLLA